MGSSYNSDSDDNTPTSTAAGASFQDSPAWGLIPGVHVCAGLDSVPSKAMSTRTSECDLCRNRVFADVTKFRWGHAESAGSLNAGTGVLLGEGRLLTQTQMEHRMPREDGDRLGNTRTSQRGPRVAGNHRKLRERQGRGSSSELPERWALMTPWPWAPCLQSCDEMLFYASWCVALGHSTPGTPIQGPAQPSLMSNGAGRRTKGMLLECHVAPTLSPLGEASNRDGFIKCFFQYCECFQNVYS